VNLAYICTTDCITYTHRKQYFKLCRQKKLQANLQDIANLDTIKNIGEWWKLSSKLRQVRPRISNNISADEFACHFQWLYAQNQDSNSFAWCLPRINDPFLDCPFELREMKLVLQKCKVNKAPGRIIPQNRRITTLTFWHFKSSYNWLKKLTWWFFTWVYHLGVRIFFPKLLQITFSPP